MNMLGLAKRTNAKFLLASTSEVYGDPLEHPQRETYWGNVNPIGERSCYDEGADTVIPNVRSMDDLSFVDVPCSGPSGGMLREWNGTTSLAVTQLN